MRRVWRNTMIFLVSFLMILVCFPVFLVSCSTLQFGSSEDTELVKQKKAYLTARKEFALTLEKYNTYYERAPPEQQAEWKENVDPWFVRTNVALDAWRLALDKNGDPIAQEQKYLELKSDLLILLVDVFN